MKFLKANLINIFFSGFLAILNMVLSIVEARVMGPIGVGNYQIFVSTQTVITTLFAFGLGSAGIYYINSGKSTSQEFITTVLKAELILCSVVFVSLFTIIKLWPDYFGTIPFHSLLIYCIGSSATLLSTAITPVLLAKFQIIKYQSVSFVTTVLSIVAIGIIYLKYGTLQVSNLIDITGICRIIGAICLLWFIKIDFVYGLKFSIKILWVYMKYGIQFAMSNVAYICILNVPIYAISWLVSDGYFGVGLYTRAVAICTIAMFVNKQIGPLFFSKLSGSSDVGKVEQAKLMATFFLIFNASMVITINIFANNIVSILYGIDFLPAVPLVHYLSLSVIFTGLNELINNLLSSIGKPRYIFFNLIISVLILIPVIYIFIKYFGLIGAPLAVTIVNCLTTVLLIKTLRKHLPISYTDLLLLTPAKIRCCLEYFRFIKK